MTWWDDLMYWWMNEFEHPENALIVDDTEFLHTRMSGFYADLDDEVLEWGAENLHGKWELVRLELASTKRPAVKWRAWCVRFDRDVDLLMFKFKFF